MRSAAQQAWVPGLGAKESDTGFFSEMFPFPFLQTLQKGRGRPGDVRLREHWGWKVGAVQLQDILAPLHPVPLPLGKQVTKVTWPAHIWAY